ncbi:MAG: DMP19 family protein [Treponema sp.]|uniref:DMP19 family protein n=1 Tax=Treponema sp. TaxID=166 RepID=UPI003FA2D19B
MKKIILTLLIVLGVSCMLFGKDSGNWKKYESLKKDDYSINEKYWKKYKGISKELANEIPAERLYEVVDNYVAWIIGNSYDTEMDKKLQKLPLAIKYAYLVYTYECEINNGGFDQFYFNSIGYEVFELQKGLEFFGLIKNKMLLDKSLELLKQKIDIKNYYELSSKQELPTEDFEEEFNELNSQFYDYPEKIEEIINEYLNKHRGDLITV